MHHALNVYAYRHTLATITRCCYSLAWDSETQAGRGSRGRGHGRGTGRAVSARVGLDRAGLQLKANQ